MSERSVKNFRCQKESRLQPAILRRKRKTTTDSENINIDDHRANKRHQEFQNQTSYDPGIQDNDSQEEICSSIVKTTCISNSSEILDACQRTPSDVLASLTLSQFRGLACMSTPEEQNSPLPHLSWADPREVWENMVQKDAVYLRDSKLLSRHPDLQARMRAILLDWLIEVCEVYRLHRESFYLAQDFIDRYLATQQNLPKQQLQLLGITSLFVAAKIEEIYPPKLSEFAYVTDGACTETEILEKEIVLLKTLKWNLMPMTVNSWLNVYLQLAGDFSKTRGNDFLLPEYSTHTFVQVARLIDLCILDVECLQFSYSVVAAAALHHITPEISFSGLKKNELAACVDWMAPFAVTLKECGGVQLNTFHQVDNMHTIQAHNIDLQLLEKVHARQAETNMFTTQASPKSGNGTLTPPQSNEKGSQSVYT
ncbi:G1/S-specific cyclin-E1-like isoform X2 [Tachypleus tridentatus]|uniref:G1/S-specific cyclin-E1-like isoform X2 n=1 Tax=Tachypleus tridentatus TaxID=6853 RepID=UPI003FD10F70